MVVVGELRLRRADVQVLHAIVCVPEDWSSTAHIARWLRGQYAEDWYDKRVDRCVARLRRQGLVLPGRGRYQTYAAVPEAVAVAAKRCRAIPATLVLWEEVEEYVSGSPAAVLKRYVRGVTG